MGLLKKLGRSVEKVAGFLVTGRLFSSTKVVELYRLFKNRNKKQGNTFEDAGLQDKSYSPADYGAPLTIGFGKFKTNGKVIYSMPEFREGSRTRREGDTTYIERTYDIDIAWKVCKGPVIGISRLWLDDVLILDVRSGTTGAIGNRIVNYAVASDGTVSFERNLAADIARESWKIYLGSDTQLPDAMMETNIGAGNVPAHRGWCYITCSRLYLNDYQRRVPNIAVEVVAAGSIGAADLGTFDVVAPIPPAAGIFRVEENVPIHYDIHSGLVLTIINDEQSSPRKTTICGVDPVTHEIVFTKDHQFDAVATWEFWTNKDQGAPYIWASDSVNIFAYSTLTGDKVFKRSRSGLGSTHFNRCVVDIFVVRDELWMQANSGHYVFSYSGIIAGSSLLTALKRVETNFNSPGQPDWLLYIPHREMMLSQLGASASFGLYTKELERFGPYSPGGTYDIANQFVVDSYNDCLWTTVRIPSPLSYDLFKFDLATKTYTLIATGFGSVTSSATALFVDENRRAVAVYRQSSGKFEWYNGAGTKIHELSMTISGNPPIFATYLPAHNKVMAMRNAEPYKTIGVKQVDGVSGTTVGLDAVITSLSSEVGIGAPDLSVSTLSTSFINGFAIEDRGPAKQALDILQRTSFFDLLQENGKITAKKRGGASIMTIDADELAMQEG